MLRYASPARSWEEALPVGNGRLGAMLYGTVHTETLHLNEESVWYGGPQDRTPLGAKEHLPRLRQLIRDGKHREAEQVVKERFLATPKSARHYEPLGICNIAFDYDSEGFEPVDYERTLDLQNGQTNVQFSVNGNRVQRQVIASHADDVLAVRFQAQKPVTFSVSLTRMSDIAWEVNEFLDSIHIENGCIVMHATPGGKESNAICLAVTVRLDDAEGSVSSIGKELHVKSKGALLVFAAHTKYRHANVQEAVLANIAAALDHTTEQLWLRHSESWSSSYNCMSLQMHPDDTMSQTNIRLNDRQDPGLASLYFNYARYLLLSCSRAGPGALPSNLQGIWSPTFQPSWGSKFTININLQMNYWLAHSANISKSEYPLFEMLERMASNGQKTALEMYGCRGWCAHHCTDIFGDTETQDRWMPATLWPLGGAWLCTHIFQHYVFTANRPLLKRMFPVLRGCVHFLTDFLTFDPTGRYLVTNPSLSPENTFLHPMSGEKGVFCEGSTIDTEIVRHVCQDYLSSATVLLGEVVADETETVQTILESLSPIIVSPKTQTIQEWGLNDYDETELGHRHMSHLYALHPGTEITPTETPRLALAAKNTMLRRLKHGGGHTGWSRAWLINLWARLREPEQCAQNIEALLRDSTLPNLLDTHPPFQIDGNFGGAAGILECLVQSHEEYHPKNGSSVTRLIRLLPSCPASWDNGSIHGVKCRGGFELSFSWVNGQVNSPITVINQGAESATLVVHKAGSDASDQGILSTIPARAGRHDLSIC